MVQSRGSLYYRIFDFENLCLAFYKAAKGKRDRSEVQVYSRELFANLSRLRQQLERGCPIIGNYRFFTVYDPKMREICAASFEERILHHAVMNICEPVFESYSIHDSYACRRGKGQRKAVLRGQEFSRRYAWYLKLDIRRYFDSIHHTTLLQLLAGFFMEKEILTLFEKIFASYNTSEGRGLPIGNLISQHCANLYLSVFDHWVKDQKGVKGYVRYMDDFLLFHNSKKYLKDILKELEGWLEDRLKLQLKDNIQLNKCRFGIPFLGYRLYPGRILLTSASRKRFIRKFRKYELNWVNGYWSDVELVHHMEPLLDFVRFAESRALRRSVIARYGVFP